jgi:hypothetical protein
MSGSRRRQPSQPRRGSQPHYRPTPGYYDPRYDHGGYPPPAEYSAAYDVPPNEGEGWYSQERGTGGLFSPLRVTLWLLIIGSAAIALYGMFIDKTTLQIPLTVSGLAVLGISLALMAWSSARGAASLGRRGYGGKALIAALFGGICALGAAGALSGAFVLGMLAASA